MAMYRIEETDMYVRVPAMCVTMLCSSVSLSTSLLPVLSYSKHIFYIFTIVRIFVQSILLNFSFPAPLGPPQNFTATVQGPRTIELSWTRPTTPNGFITAYTLQYMDRDMLMTEMLDENTLSYVADGLNEFTDYSFTISASTRVGSGPTDTVEAMTEEDGK